MKLMQNILKKNKTLTFFVLSLLLIIGVIIGYSSAYFIQSDLIENNIVTTNCFKLSFVDQNDIYLDKTYPLTEQEGSNLIPYIFTMKNVCTIASEYEVNVETINISTLSTSYLRYKLDNNTSDILGQQLEKYEYINQNINESRNIETGVLLPNEEKTYNLRIWVDEDTTTKQTANKEYKGKVIVKSIENKDPYQTIKLHPNNGIIEHSEIIRIKTRKLGSIEEPIRTGYSFKGWYLDSELDNKVNEDLIVDNTLTDLYAKWESNRFTINFDSNGGETPSITRKEVTYNEEYGNLATTSRLGYNFLGWYTASSGGEKIETTDIVKITEDTTLYAHWEIITYNITYTLNGGSASNPATYTVEDQITLNNPTRTGYNFTGWSGSGTGTSVTIPKGSTGDKSYTAVFEVINYTITYNYNGGSASNPSTYTVEDQITLNNPTKTGYNFIGWSGSGTGTSVTIPRGTTGNKSYTANWGLKSYTVTISAGTGLSAGASSINVSYSSQNTVTITPSAGYYLSGASCTNGYTTNASTGTSATAAQTITIKNNGNDKTSTCTFNATAITYSISYNYNGGSASNPTTYNVTTNTITLNNPTRTGYTFTGWSGSGSGTTVTIPKGTTGNKSYTANWRANTFTVLYAGNGSTEGQMTTQTCTYDQACSLNSNAFNKTGYNFAGWKKDNSGNTLAPGTSIKNVVTSGTVSYYAQWNVKTIAVTFNCNGGSGGNTQTFIYGYANQVFTPVCTRDGYTQVSWKASDGGTYSVWSGVSDGWINTYSPSITLYAEWSRDDLYLLGGNVHWGWNLSNFYWECWDSSNCDGSWQLNGNSENGGCTDSFVASYTEAVAMTQNTYNLTDLNNLNVSFWHNGDSKGPSNIFVAVCSNSSNCNIVADYYYPKAATCSGGNWPGNENRTITGNISGYNGNYYIKVTVLHDYHGGGQINVGGVTITK